MISCITGIVHQRSEDSVTILVGGIGLRVFVPTSVLEATGTAGRGITLHTHLHLRENQVALYGFHTADELQLFELLLGTAGVGPRLALAILSTLSPDVLSAAVVRGEPGILQRVPGIGKKTAERVLFHLKDKLRLEGLPLGAGGLSEVDAEAAAALTALGYSVVEAQSAVQRLPRETPPELEERVRSALRMLGS